MTFDSLDLNDLNLDGGAFGNVYEVDFSNLPTGTITCDDIEDINNDLCKFKNLDNSSVYFPGGYKDKNVNNNDFNNSIVYSGGDINVDNMNEISNVTFVIEGILSAKNLNGQLGFNNSTVVFSGLFKAENTVVTNSTIITDDDLNISGKLVVQGASKICVAGKLLVEGPGHLTIKSTSNIYLNLKDKNDVTINHQYNLHNSDKGPEILTPEKFSEICSVGFSTFPSVKDNWKEPIIDVEY